LIDVLLCAAGVQVPQYEEEFRQLFLLTLDKLKQVDIRLMWSTCLLFVGLSRWLHLSVYTLNWMLWYH